MNTAVSSATCARLPASSAFDEPQRSRNPGTDGATKGASFPKGVSSRALHHWIVDRPEEDELTVPAEQPLSQTSTMHHATLRPEAQPAHRNRLDQSQLEGFDRVVAMLTVSRLASARSPCN